ncbi:MAG TPA: hypothetical protein DF383_10655 [Deltaproteobacteria bacterium]|nr:hypothetical protein [Deltaproteobacteria bacterium]
MIFWVLIFLMHPKSYSLAGELRPENLKKISYAVADPNQIASTPGGLMLLHYIAACALKPDQELTAQVGNKKYSFSGSLGFAPEWLNAPLSKSGQRWISACLMAHVNYFGVHVPISVRAAHPNVASNITEEEKKVYPVREAAFYGNLFDPEELPYVCRGHDEKNQSDYLKLRVCSEESQRPPFTRCDFVSTGICDSVDPTQYEKICNQIDAKSGFFQQCQGSDRRYEEVVTVFLQK